MKVVLMGNNTTQQSISSLISTDFATILHDAPVSKLMSILKQSEGLPVVVVNGDDYKGLVSNSSLLRNVDVSKSKISSILHMAPTLTSSHSLDDAIRLMRDADVRALPVVEKQKVVGVVPARALLNALVKSTVFSNVSASQLVSANPLSVSPDDDVGKALQLMRSKNIRKLAVMGERGNIDGILKLEELAGDILLNVDRGSRGAYKKGYGTKSIDQSSAMTVQVKSLMDENPVSMLGSEKASNVLKSLASQNNPVVVVQGKGLITTQDIFNYYLSNQPRPVLPISITHLPDIDAIDRAFVEETLSRTFTKVARVLKSDHSLKAVFKQTNKSGLRAQTTVKLTIEGAGRPIYAKSVNWKVRLATKEACKTLENEISHAFNKGKSR
ncbi:MAG: CBS domain-containing protein [Candidatus Diapherotrites archaeon]|uniref:CBS domain-containing protein n=1 Tax=Candidatus Iainarchaeum sp. TaxID=3101447 RepID=A0A8T4C8F8_9ARCH|nr:CBS domain-containing protein [Candidatus Diapherotrites archaeon]